MVMCLGTKALEVENAQRLINRCKMMFMGPNFVVNVLSNLRRYVFPDSTVYTVFLKIGFICASYKT